MFKAERELFPFLLFKERGQMAVTTRTADQLIKKAYRIIGYNAKDRNLPQDYIVEGLYNLNLLLDSYSVSPDLISYDHVISFPLVIGQADYVISDQVAADVTNRRLVSLKYVNLIDGDHSYVVQIESDKLYYDFERDNTLTQRPTYCYLQLDVGESILSFVPKPDKTYTCIVKGKFILDQLDLTSELTAIPIGYHKFLIYALARHLSSELSGSNWSEIAEDIYQQALEDVRGNSDKNLELKDDSLFVRQGRYRHNINALNVI